MFYLGIITGILLTLIFIFIGYIIWRELIFKYGKIMRERIENEINKLEDKTKEVCVFIEPNIVKEILDKSDNIPDNLIK